MTTSIERIRAMTKSDKHNVVEANAALIGTLVDHTLFLQALLSGAARWDRNTREVAVGGIRHGTHSDEFGCPVLTDNLREALAAAVIGR